MRIYKSTPQHREYNRLRYLREKEKLNAQKRANYRRNMLNPEWRQKRNTKVGIDNEYKKFGRLRKDIIASQCTICNSSKTTLVIHHINGEGSNTKNPDNRPENLITLCKTCHWYIHFDSGKLEQTPLVVELVQALGKVVTPFKKVPLASD